MGKEGLIWFNKVGIRLSGTDFKGPYESHLGEFVCISMTGLALLAPQESLWIKGLTMQRLHR